MDLPPLILTMLLILFLLKLGAKLRAKNSDLPPGPWKLPFLGNLHQLVGSPPHRSLRDLAKKFGPIMLIQLGEVPTIVVSSPETAKEVMQTQDINFATRPPMVTLEIMAYNSTNIAFAPYGDYWRQLRKICTLELLSSSRVRSFRSLREEETSNLMKWIASNEGTTVNLTENVVSSSYTATSRAAFGKKSLEQESFVSIVQEIMKLASGFNVTDVYPSIKFLHVISGTMSKIQALHKRSDSILETIISEHRTKICNPEADKDLVDVLLGYHRNQNAEFSLTIDNIKAVLMDIFMAGSGTSAKTVDWAMAEMMKNPRIMEKAKEEVREVFREKGHVDEGSFDKLKYLKLVIKETLRLHPPAPLLLPRESNERCRIHGYEIPGKTKVVVNGWAINRDPSYWKDAEMFYPERFLDSLVDYKGTHFEYIPFGAGRRVCPGIQFGMANIELLLAKFLYHFDWNLPSGMKHEELDMTEAFGLSIRRKDDLHLIPTVRNNPSSLSCP